LLGNRFFLLKKAKKITFMKNAITLLFALIITTILSAQTTVVKTLNPQKCPNVNIKVPNHLIEQEAWDEGGVRIDITIEVDLPDAVLQELVKAGRYELLGKKIEDAYILSVPNMDIPISVAEKAIKEMVSIKVTTPKYIAMNATGVLYKDIDEDAIRGGSRSDTREEIEAVIKQMKEIREDLNVEISVVSTAANQVVDLTSFSLTVGRNVVLIGELDFPVVGE
jgi:hypothetical protein